MRRWRADLERHLGHIQRDPPRQPQGATKRWWTIFVDLATGALMLTFAVSSAQRLMVG